MNHSDTHHVRTAAALRNAQQCFDGMAPEEADDEWLTPEQAEEVALKDLSETPAVVSCWLDAECTDDSAPLPAYLLGDVLMSGERELCVPELLAVLMLNPEREAMRALHLLREKFAAALSDHIDAEARRLLARQEADIERQMHDAMDEMAEWGRA